MRTRHALAIGTLVAAAALAAGTPEPTLATLNDVVTVEVGLSAWHPVPPATSTTGQPSATAPAADDPFTPLTTPAAADDVTDETGVPPTTPPAAPPRPDDGTQPGTPGAGAPVAEPATGDTVPEPAVGPVPGTTVSPAEEAPSVTGTSGPDAGDGAAPTSPEPTSQG